MREQRIAIGRHELLIARPDDPERLIDEDRFGEDEFMPYWAELWASGIALARHVVGLALGGRRVLEVGCGLALPSFAAALAGAHVLATDWAPDALELVTRNAAANGLRVETAPLDWGAARPPEPSSFDLVLAADVLYEERNAQPVLALLGAAVAADGTALVADPGRRHAMAFFEAARRTGWLLKSTSAEELPSGTITTLRRPASARRRP
jgi:predicted nicotinamide N-methyase